MFEFIMAQTVFLCFVLTDEDALTREIFNANFHNGGCFSILYAGYTVILTFSVCCLPKLGLGKEMGLSTSPAGKEGLFFRQFIFSLLPSQAGAWEGDGFFVRVPEGDSDGGFPGFE